MLSIILASRITPNSEEILGIINVHFDATGHLPILIHSAFVKYFRKNGNTMKQFINYLDTLRKFKKAYGSIRREVLYNILNKFGILMKLGRLI